MRLFSLLFILAATSTTHADVWESGVPAQAQIPQGKVDGTVYYYRFEDATRPVEDLPNLNCVLIHGHGVSQKILDLVFANFSKGPLENFNASVVGLTSDVLPPAIGERVERLARLNAVSAFSYFMFGKPLIDGLLASACGYVYVPVQESTQTSIFELTRRTEGFVREVACTQDAVSPGQNACALVGHSKGGAAVTAITRRCASETSELGEVGCRRLGEVYSASGVNEGVGLPIVLMAARTSEERKAKFEKLSMGLVDTTQAFEEGMARLKRIDDLGKQIEMDILGDKTDISNPLWYDLGPLAPMDGGQPIAVIQGENFVPRKAGWIANLEYAANASGFRFDKFKYDSTTDDKGVKTFVVAPGQAEFITTGHIVADEPRPELLPRALVGNLFPKFKGERIRRALDFLWYPFEPIQTEIGKAFNEKIADFHGDSQAALMHTLGKSEIASQSPELAKAMQRFSWLPDEKRPGELIAVQESDGLVERGSALGACERGQKEPEATRIVADCKDFGNINHLGVSGMSLESGEHILRSLQTRR